MAALADITQLASDLRSAAAYGSEWNPVEDLRTWFGTTGVNFDAVQTEAQAGLDWLAQGDLASSDAFSVAARASLAQVQTDYPTSPAGRLAGNLHDTYGEFLRGSLTHDQAATILDQELEHAQSDQVSEQESAGSQAKTLVTAGASHVFTWLFWALAGALTIALVIVFLVLSARARISASPLSEEESDGR